MLGEDYPQLLESLISTLRNDIALPVGLEGFFDVTGTAPPYHDEQRCNIRTNVRTYGVMAIEREVPMIKGRVQPAIVYTKDFSKNGFGFISSDQLFPGEVVRILLATFWMRIGVCRCRRLGPNCYECGGRLLDQHAPSMDAALHFRN